MLKGALTLIGSGETSPGMAKVHGAALARLRGGGLGVTGVVALPQKRPPAHLDLGLAARARDGSVAQFDRAGLLAGGAEGDGEARGE